MPPADDPWMANLVAYLRVSTETQADSGYGLDTQREHVEAWAARNGHTVVSWHQDEGITGKVDETDRPALAAALVAAESVAGLVVPKLDRLARKLTVQEAILAQVWRTGGRVYTTDLGEVLRDDPDDPMRTAMRQMVGVFAELEARMIAARLRAGRRTKAARGGYAGFGSPRFGTRAEERELVADATEQAVIARMVELRDEGASLRSITEALNAEGLAPKRGTRWYPETVRRVLRRLEPPAAEAA